MVAAEAAGVGLAQLRANKLRSFLTLLGIMIGVAAVIAVVSLGEGMRRTVMAEFASAGGAGTVLVNPPDAYERVGGRRVQRSWVEHLTSDDLDAFHDATDLISAAVPGMGGRVRLQYGRATLEARFTGTNDDFVSCFNWPVALGRAISHEDVRYARKVCMITQRVQQDLFGGRNPIGRQIRLDADRYTVIGVMAPRVRYGRDAGHEVMIPYTTGQKRITGNRHLYGITLFVEALERVEQVEAIVKRVLRFRHEHGDQFQVRTSKQQMESADQTIRIMQMVGGGIAGISLLVGGIGIMNIMLVSVTERTREIGIRKALGAKPGHLLVQFVAEAILLSLAGGLLGVMGGLGLGYGFESLLARTAIDFPFTSVVSLPSALAALAFASLVGLFFGVYPAVRAARMDPVEALRYE